MDLVELIGVGVLLNGCSDEEAVVGVEELVSWDGVRDCVVVVVVADGARVVVGADALRT